MPSSSPEEGILGPVIVVDGDARGVPDGIGRPRLPQETLTSRGIIEQLVMQQLDGKARATPMRRLVDSRHATDPQQALEAQLPLQDVPNSGSKLVSGGG